MNQCIKCSKEIPEGELFCIECSLNPGSSLFEEDRPSDRIPIPKGKMQTPHPVKYVRVQAPQTVTVQKHSANKGLIAALVMTLLLLGLVVGLVVWQYGDFQAEKNRLRTKEADLALRMEDLDDLQSQIDDLTLQLEESQTQLEEKDQQIAALKAQLNSSQSNLTQDQYDLVVKEQELAQLEEENLELLALCDELQLRIDELEEARSTLETALDMARVYKDKAEFMDSYVVFVESDGSNHYHTYDCSNFTRSKFWAYSRKLAEAQGFDPCPVCKGMP